MDPGANAINLAKLQFYIERNARQHYRGESAGGCAAILLCIARGTYVFIRLSRGTVSADIKSY